MLQHPRMREPPRPVGVGLRALHRSFLERPADAHDRRQAAIRRADGQRPIGKHHQPDAVVVRGHDLRKARRDVCIQPESVQPTRAHPAESAGVDRDQHIEMLVLAEFARDEPLRVRAVAFQSMRASGSPVRSRATDATRSPHQRCDVAGYLPDCHVDGRGRSATCRARRTIRSDGCRSRDHHARPSGPSSRAGITGHGCGPSRTGSSVNASRPTPPRGATNCAGTAPAARIPPARRGEFNRRPAATTRCETRKPPVARGPGKPAGRFRCPQSMAARRTRNASNASPDQQQRRRQFATDRDNAGSLDQMPAIASTAVSTIST